MDSRPRAGDALVVVDMQSDFVDGALAVPDAAAIVPVVQRYVRHFEHRGLPVIASRDWHPNDHASFHSRGGPWPAHCVQGLPGAAFCAGLHFQPEAHVISKGTDPGHDAYSAFDHTDLKARLQRLEVHRLFVCGLATEYCVGATVMDALGLGHTVFVLSDAIRAIDPSSGEQSVRKMRSAGAIFVDDLDLALSAERLHG